mmetsp:Transcript_37362/g.90137  ORF Transcript_37362/g.90137 Transcript_37362/m.90137 type:complete len:284 (+) Transcript_37362:360-1211(+)
MTAPIHNSGHGIDERIITPPAPNKSLEIVDVIPSLVVSLEGSYPIKHPRYPLQLRMILPAAHRARILAKIYVRVPAIPSLVRGLFAEVIIQHSEVTYSRCLNHSPSPPTTSLDVRPAVRIRHRLVVHIPSSLLSGVVRAKLRRILPRIIAHVTIIPITHKLVLALGTAKQRTGRPIPIRLRSRPLLHIQIDIALHMFAPLRTRIILIRLPQLPARIRQRVPPVDDVPIILVASVVLDRFLHALREEGGDVHEPHRRALRAGDVLSHVECHAAHALQVHDLQPP